MKTLIILVLIASSSFVLNKSKNSFIINLEIKQNLRSIPTGVPHISSLRDTTYNLKDNYPLWKDDKNLKHQNYEHPFYNGVSGSTWSIPIGEKDDYPLISSPMPRPSESSSRIIANEIPSPSLSESIHYDYPKRKDVVQVNLPVSSTKIETSHIAPRYPLKVPVETTNELLLHGTVFPTMFLEKKLKKGDVEKKLREIHLRAQNINDDYGLNREDSTLIYDIKMKNKQDKIKRQPLKMKKTKASIRARHTHKKLN